jgi:hypothetical protein
LFDLVVSCQSDVWVVQWVFASVVHQSAAGEWAFDWVLVVKEREWAISEQLRLGSYWKDLRPWSVLVKTNNVVAYWSLGDSDSVGDTLVSI